MTNPILDRNGKEIEDGDAVRFIDDFDSWEESDVRDVGSALAIEVTGEVVLLYNYVKSKGYVDAFGEYNGNPVAQLEVNRS